MGGQALKIAVDTNVLVRALVGDDKKQSAIAEAALRKAASVMISASTFCELVWVLEQGYGVSRDEISRAITTLIDSENVVVNRTGRIKVFHEMESALKWLGVEE